MNVAGHIQSIAAILPIVKELLGRPNEVMKVHSQGLRHSKGSLPLLLLSLQSCLTLCDPIDGSPLGSLSLGFSRQELWSGLPFPSPRHESEK